MLILIFIPFFDHPFLTLAEENSKNFLTNIKEDPVNSLDFATNYPFDYYKNFGITVMYKAKVKSVTLSDNSKLIEVNFLDCFGTTTNAKIAVDKSIITNDSVIVGTRNNMSCYYCGLPLENIKGEYGIFIGNQI